MKKHAEGLLWFASLGCLYAAALTSSKVYLPFIAVVWAVTMVAVVPLHFIRAWRKLGAVPNKTQYAAWVGFETICAVALVGGFVWLFVPSHVTSIPEARELTLRQDLHVMRAVLDQYVVDKHKRPSSLDELVATGYLKQVPTDPMTGRNDSWAAEWSNDQKTPGIVLRLVSADR
jgi:general secretion pathway protein G